MILGMGWVSALFIWVWVPLLLFHVLVILAARSSYPRSSILMALWSVLFIVFALIRPDSSDVDEYTAASNILYMLGLRESVQTVADATLAYSLGAALPVLDLLILLWPPVHRRLADNDSVRSWWNNRDGSKDS